MSFARVFGDFPKWFHILGQSSSTPPDQLLSASARNYFHRVHANALKHIPVAALVLITIPVTIVVCLYSGFWAQLTYTLSSGFSKIINAQNAFILAVDSFTISITVSQTIFLSPDFSQLFTQINIIEHLSRPNIKWDLFGLRRFVIRRMFYVCAGYTLPYVTILLIKPNTVPFLILLGGDLILKSLTLISFFQLLFYIELFNHMMQSFVKYIEVRASSATIANITTVYSRDIDTKFTSQMFHFKLLHFNLWEFSRTINHLFGWLLVVFVLHHFVFIVFIFYHACVVLLNPTNGKELLRLASNLVSTIISMIIIISACHDCTTQKTMLIKNIEKVTFWASNCEILHSAKQELISQINNLDLSITGKGFFIINKEYIAGMTAACCTYIVIFVQMHMGL